MPGTVMAAHVHKTSPTINSTTTCINIHTQPNKRLKKKSQQKREIEGKERKGKEK
jgi:hypothetical protein